MADSPPGGGSPLSDEAAISLGRRVGVGCFSVFVGTWSGGMVAVLIGKAVEGARRSPGCEGLPICNWYVYAMAGAIIGAVTLPALVFWRLRRGEAPQSNSRG